MTSEQAILLAIVGVTLGLFMWGRIRQDLVALLALTACVIGGFIPGKEAFLGFGSPVVVTVAAVLILSHGLQTSGAVDILADKILPKNKGVIINMLALLILGVVLSSFMNNVGAMALLMPIAIQMAKSSGIPVGQFLMPLAFATIMGGMTTLIGTPPNLIVSDFREQAVGKSFEMFDFTPVGGITAALGILFLVFLARRLVPKRRAEGADMGDVQNYQTNLSPLPDSAILSMSVGEFEKKFEKSNAKVNAIIRGETRIDLPSPDETFKLGDIVFLEASLRIINQGLGDVGLVPAGDYHYSLNKPQARAYQAVILPQSPLIGKTADEVEMKSKFSIGLLAIARGDRQIPEPVVRAHLRAGDVLLMHGTREAAANFAHYGAILLLSERGVHFPNKRTALYAALIMIASVLVAAFGLLPTAVAFVLGAVMMSLTGIIPVRRLYDAIDWRVIVLLASMLPIAGAFQSTGTAELIADFLLNSLAGGRAVFALMIVLVFTMFMANLLSTAATAAMMCPVAVQSAAAVGANVDSFLMAVAVGASCAFVTPIGHQNNTLILGPGGFKFSDYWRLGLPLGLLVFLVSTPLLLFFWPL